MGKRFNCTAYSSKGVEYDLEIHDINYTGAVTEFKSSRDFFRINYKGEPSKRMTYIMASECSFEFIVEDATHEALITDFVTAKENQFLIQIKKGGANFWRGVVIYDTVVIEDKDYPFSCTINAVCGLSLLKDIPYLNSGVIYEGTASFKTHAIRLLNYIQTLPLYHQDEEYMKTSIDWWDSNVTPANGTDPWEKYGCDDAAFYDFKDTGGVDQDVLSAFDALNEICKAWDCKVAMFDGSFWFMQPSYMTGSFVSRNYKKTGVYINNTSYSGQNTINQTASGARNSGQGGTFSFLPAIRKVDLKVNTYTRRNIWVKGALIYDWGGTNPGDTFTYDIDTSGDFVTLRIQGTMEGSVLNASYSGATNNTIHLMFRFLIKVGSYYLKRNYTKSSPTFTPLYGAQSWETTQEYYYFHVSLSPIPGSGTSEEFVQNINHITKKLQGNGGSNEFGLQFYAIEKGWEAGQTTSGDLEVNFELLNSYIEVLQAENKADYFMVTVDGDAENTYVHEMETRLCGFEFGNQSVGRIRRWSGSAWLATADTGWGIGTGAKDKTFSNLLALTTIRAQYTPTRTANTNIYGTLVLYKKYDFDSNDWLMMQGDFNAGRDEIRGTFHVLYYGSSGVTSTPVKVIKLQDDQVPIYGAGGMPVSAPSPPITQNSGGFQMAQNPIILSPVAHNYLGAPKAASTGATTLTLATASTGADYAVNDVVTIVNPVTGQFENVTVTTAPSSGSTTLSVTGTLTADYPQNAFLIKKPVAIAGGGGTVTSVALTMPSGFTVGGSPITSSGTLAVTMASQTQRLFFATPSGASGAATFRAIAAVDVPTLNQNTTGTASNVTGTVAVANGGTGATSAPSAITNLGATTAGGNLFTLTNPSAVRFIRINANNTISALTDSDFRTAIGAGTGNGTVTVSGSITNEFLPVFSSSTNVIQSGLRYNNTDGLTIGLINARTTAAVDYLTQTSGIVQKRTVAEVLSDIGAAGKTGTPVAGQVAYWDSATAVKGNGQLTFTDTSGSPVLNVEDTSSSSASSAVLQVIVAANANANPAKIVINNKSTATTADSLVHFIIENDTAKGCVIGIDAQDEIFKIQSRTALGGTQGINVKRDVTEGDRVGINTNNPAVTLDVIGKSRSRVHMTDTQSTSSAFGGGAGSSPTETEKTVTGNVIRYRFTCGTSPGADQDIVTFTINASSQFTNFCYASVSPANAATASEITKFFPSTTSAGTLTITANGTLTAGAQYALHITMHGY